VNKQKPQSPYTAKMRLRACLKNHSYNLHASICGRFCLHSVDVARYAALIQAKSPANCDAHLAESIFQTRSRASSSCGRAAWTQGNEAFLQYRGFEVSSVYSSPTYILCYTKYSLRKQRG
jgi:hypothetical protein